MCGVAGMLIPEDHAAADGCAIAVFFPFQDPLIIVTQYGSAPPGDVERLRNAIEQARVRSQRSKPLRLLADRIGAAAMHLRFWK